MISQTAVTNFFMILNVLSDPELAKRELDIFNGKLDEIKKREEALELRSVVIVQAEAVLATQKKVRAELDDMKAKLHRSQQEQDQYAGVLDKRAANISSQSAAVEVRMADIAMKDKNLQSLQDVLSKRENTIAAREAALNKRVAEFSEEKNKHQKRINQLRSLV